MECGSTYSKTPSSCHRKETLVQVKSQFKLYKKMKVKCKRAFGLMCILESLHNCKNKILEFILMKKSELTILLNF